MTCSEHLFLLETPSREVFRGVGQIGVMSRNCPGIIVLISVDNPLNIKMESSSENHVPSWLDSLLVIILGFHGNRKIDCRRGERKIPFFSVSHHFKSSPINVQTLRHKKSSQSRKKCVSFFFFFNVNFLNAVLPVHVADRYIIRRGLLF